jgi:hypothetical protein
LDIESLATITSASTPSSLVIDYSHNANHNSVISLAIFVRLFTQKVTRLRSLIAGYCYGLNVDENALNTPTIPSVKSI